MHPVTGYLPTWWPTLAWLACKWLCFWASKAHVSCFPAAFSGMWYLMCLKILHCLTSRLQDWKLPWMDSARSSWFWGFIFVTTWLWHPKLPTVVFLGETYYTNLPLPSKHSLQSCCPTAQDLDVLDLFCGHGGVHKSCRRSLNVCWLGKRNGQEWSTHRSLRFQGYDISQIRQGLGQGIHGYDNDVQFSVVGLLEKSDIGLSCFFMGGNLMEMSQNSDTRTFS